MTGCRKHSQIYIQHQSYYYYSFTFTFILIIFLSCTCVIGLLHLHVFGWLQVLIGKLYPFCTNCELLQAWPKAQQ
jgi:hypothetical protein